MSNLHMSEGQREHSEWLASIPRDQRCACGWYLKSDKSHICRAKKEKISNPGWCGSLRAVRGVVYLISSPLSSMLCNPPFNGFLTELNIPDNKV